MILYFVTTNSATSCKCWSERILFSTPGFLIETNIASKIQNSCSKGSILNFSLTGITLVVTQNVNFYDEH